MARERMAEVDRNVAVLLYDGFTALDAVGPYEVLCRVPGVTVTMVAENAGRVRTDTGSLTLGIDMGLHLAARLSDERTAQAMQLAVEYDPVPPYDTGSPEKAGPELQQLALKLLADSAR